MSLLIFTFLGQMFETLQRTPQSTVSSVNTFTQKAKPSEGVSPRTVVQGQVAARARREQQQQHVEEIKHQQVNSSSDTPQAPQDDGTTLNPALVQHQETIAVKDQQIAELSNRLDELQKQVATALLTTTTTQAADESEMRVVRRAIEQWRLAWQSQDTTAYLWRYTSDFRPANGLSHRAWRKDRRRKIERPKTISVQIRGLQLQRLDDQRWQVVFEQTYKSDTYRDVVKKELVMIKIDDQYLIETERNL